jgi:hypothetical protein
VFIRGIGSISSLATGNAIDIDQVHQHEVANPIRFIAEEHRLCCEVVRRGDSVARHGPRARHIGPADFQMNGTVVISYDFQKAPRPGFCSGAVPKTLNVAIL